jgi:predicted nucleic acid-binding protein
MIRVVPDANIFVSAVLKATGNPARILELVKEKKKSNCSSRRIFWPK